MKVWIQVGIVMCLGALAAACASPNSEVGSISPNTPAFSAWQATQSQPEPSTPMPEGLANAERPVGFIGFCIRFQDQCANPASAQNTVALTEANWRTMNDINDQVNDSIAPETDQEHYGRAEYWTIPTDGLGDCDDYAVSKRKALADKGFPMDTLRLAVVTTWRGDRHAVLTVTTDKGDYVLDNMTSQIVPWTRTDYEWVERQASTNPWDWVALQKDAGPQLVAATSSLSTSAR